MTGGPAGFAERARTALRPTTDYLSPLNAVVAAAVTVLDIATPSLEKGASRGIAVLAAVMAAVLLYRVHAAYGESGDGRPAVARFFAGRANKLLVAVLLFAVGLAVVGAASARERGAIALIVPATGTLQDSLFGIRKDLGEVRDAVRSIDESLHPTDAIGQLRQKGFGLDDESKARAIENCDLPVLRLYLAAGQALPEAVPVFGVRGGSVLEKPIVARHASLVELLRLLASTGMSFDARHPLSFTQAQSAQIPRFEQLGTGLPPELRMALQPAVVRASPLVVAIWFGNAEAARTLVELGAATNVGVDASLPELRHGRITGAMQLRQVSTAALEARRLERSGMLAADTAVR